MLLRANQSNIFEVYSNVVYEVLKVFRVVDFAIIVSVQILQRFFIRFLSQLGFGKQKMKFFGFSLFNVPRIVFIKLLEAFVDLLDSFQLSRSPLEFGQLLFRLPPFHD